MTTEAEDQFAQQQPVIEPEADMTQESQARALIQAEDWHRRHHHITKEEIEIAAFLNWCAGGRPLFNADKTFEFWLDAELNLEDCGRPDAPSGAGHGTE